MKQKVSIEFWATTAGPNGCVCQIANTKSKWEASITDIIPVSIFFLPHERMIQDDSYKPSQ